VLAFVLLRVVPFAGANTGRGVDSFEYAQASELSIFSGEFWGGLRAFGYPLYMKAMFHNDSAFVVVQMLVSIGAWLTFAFMAMRATKHSVLRMIVPIAVLVLGATFEVIEWDRIVSTESLTISLGVGFLAALLWLREQWTIPRVVVLSALAFALASLRDANGTFLAVVGVAVVLAVVARATPAHALVLAGVFMLAGTMSLVSADAGHRGDVPLKNVITLRILNSPEREAYFVQSGMPLTPEQVAAARGHCIAPAQPSPCVIVANDAFYAWISDDARGTYVKSLLKFPATTIWEPVAHVRDSLGTRVQVELPLAADTQERSPIGHFFEAAFFVRNPAIVMLAALAVLVTSIYALATKRRGAFVVAAAIIALTYPHLWLVWTGDALEVTRHSLLASVMLRIGIWLGALWLLDSFLTERRHHASNGTASAMMPTATMPSSQ
jgi:hypothetical protein